MKKKQFTFIDLFAGLGGFHLALEQLGGKCVFASELKEDLRNFYKQNYNIDCKGDITDEDTLKAIPDHDVLCGGFPCQPFSKAGFRQGFNDEKDRGNLFFYILRIINEHKPKYVFLENVSNLKGHDGGNTWSVIERALNKAGYNVDERILSPHHFGYPQHRQRIYITGIRKDLQKKMDWPVFSPQTKCDVKSIVDVDDLNIKKIQPFVRNYIDVWQQFIDELVKRGRSIPTFPIWAMEFGANYEYENIAPFYQTVDQLNGRRGHLGKKIQGETKEDCLNQLPNYARSNKDRKLPLWKINYIKHNREFYSENKDWLKVWLKQVKSFENSYLKLEWNCQGEAPTFSDKIVQLRASGIRVKKADYAPALNLCTTQTPMFMWVPIPKELLTKDEPKFGRYITTIEAAKLQGMEELFQDKTNCSLTPVRISEALGNAVNVNIVKLIAEKLLEDVI